MKIHKINVKGSRQRCKILLGFDVLKTLKKNIKSLFPQSKKIALIFDNGVPSPTSLSLQRSLRGFSSLGGLLIRPTGFTSPASFHSLIA